MAEAVCLLPSTRSRPSGGPIVARAVSSWPIWWSNRPERDPCFTDRPADQVAVVVEVVCSSGRTVPSLHREDRRTFAVDSVASSSQIQVVGFLGSPWAARRLGLFVCWCTGPWSVRRFFGVSVTCTFECSVLSLNFPQSHSA
jgi:hypothetical protein